MTATTPSAEGGATGPEGQVEGAQQVTLLGNTATDRCLICSAEMTPDQRYCVECGTRRGAVRFKAPRATPKRELATSTPAGISSHVSPTVTRWLAILVVLVALGVGILIGNSGKTTIVRVTGGSSAALSSSKTKSSSSQSGSDAIGSKCSKGAAGCSNGKQTGNFFGS